MNKAWNLGNLNCLQLRFLRTKQALWNQFISFLRPVNYGVAATHVVTHVVSFSTTFFWTNGDMGSSLMMPWISMHVPFTFVSKDWKSSGCLFDW